MTRVNHLRLTQDYLHVFPVSCRLSCLSPHLRHTAQKDPTHISSIALHHLRLVCINAHYKQDKQVDKALPPLPPLLLSFPP
ncbi:hypothetical protein E2C01_045565 [Portunus trituberculatus]|uniref:Uncharacterized protein n=1 Tax=Portunus trituberculatus TaxID=210409 RepID=A0A5B7G377_PORTR|nr:hypothetical protein [Portunus trituberculatus]